MFDSRKKISNAVKIRTFNAILEYCSTVWNPFIHAKYYLSMTDELENIQRYFTRRLYYRCRLDCNHDYLERINHLQLESLELRRIYNDMAMVFKIVHKFIDLKYSDLLTMFNTTNNSVTTRGFTPASNPKRGNEMGFYLC